MATAKMGSDHQDHEDGPEWVKCPECGYEQTDMGRNVACEECGEGPMPSPSADAVRKPAGRGPSSEDK